MTSQSRTSQNKAIQEDESLKKSIRQIVIRVMEQRDDWRKHLHGTCCKCQNCTCGKHRCKVRSIKMPLKSTLSTYQHDYTPKKGHRSHKLQTPELKNQQQRVFRGTTYTHDYPMMMRATSQPITCKKAKDNIQLGGPLFGTSIYQQSFTAKQIGPQKMLRGINNIGPLGFKMNTSSSYRDNFQWQKRAKSSRTQSQKRYNNLKINPQATFRNETSYAKEFVNRKLKGYDEKGNFAPNRAYQTIKAIHPQSSYRRQFVQMHSTICPAAYCDF